MTTGSGAKRAIEWLWGGQAMAALRSAGRVPSPRTRELNRRAHAAIELGRLTLDPPRPFEHGPVGALACQLYAQAVYWALLARRSLRAGAPDDAVDEPGAGPDLGALLAETDPLALARAAGSPEAAQALGAEIGGRSFLEYAGMSEAEQVRLAGELAPFAERLCDEVDGTRAEVERLWLRRALRVGALVAALAVVAWGIGAAKDRVERARDLARGKPWVASSRYPELGCTSPAQECPNSDIYFFSTNFENGPHIEWDLGKPERVSGLRVDNRHDCCTDRSVPLVVEVSLDHKTYKEVARRTQEFDRWKVKFFPVEARWVRLRVPRPTLLHLTGVRIFP
jgi:hypothetical protein